MKASVFIATSLDGFIARENGGIDWLPEDCEPHGYEEFVATIDAYVIGRKTFETVMGFGAWPYGEKPVFVLSSTMADLVPPKGAACELMAGSPQTIAGKLSGRGLTHVYVDGGVTIQRFLAAGVLGRLIITRIPVLLGTGIPLFGPLPHDVTLKHVWTRTFPSGMVQSEYSVLT